MADFQTPTVVLSFPNIAQPRAAQAGQTPKFSGSLIVKAGTASALDKKRYAALVAACKTALREKFGDKAFLPDGKVSPAFKWPFRDGAEKAHLEGYNEGDKFFNVSSTRKPGLGVAAATDGGVEIRDTTDASVFYPGCLVQAMVNPYTYDSNGNKGVSLGLNHLVFIRDGERLDGASGSASAAYEGAEIDASELGFDESEVASSGDDDLI